MLDLRRASLPIAALGVVLYASPAAAHGDCSTDADCESGEICFEEACSAPCESDADCSDDQVCAEATACQHADEHEEGCSAAGPTSAGLGLPLVGLVAAAAVTLQRLRARSK